MDRATSTRHRITLRWDDGGVETVLASEHETLVEAAEATGVGLPFGCLTGACGTCVGRVVEGRLSHARQPRALKPRHREEGFALLCVSETRSDCRIEVGADVQAALASHPWD